MPGSPFNRTVHYDYDSLSRLTAERFIQGTHVGDIVYDGAAGYSDPQSYDQAGNRGSRTVSPVHPQVDGEFAGLPNRGLAKPRSCNKMYWSKAVALDRTN